VEPQGTCKELLKNNTWREALKRGTNYSAWRNRERVEHKPHLDIRSTADTKPSKKILTQMSVSKQNSEGRDMRSSVCVVNPQSWGPPLQRTQKTGQAPGRRAEQFT